jgi:hypothetical protein
VNRNQVKRNLTHAQKGNIRGLKIELGKLNLCAKRKQKGE